MKVHIPETIEAAKASLDGLGALLQAKEWERAAIVYAFTARRGAKSGIPDFKQSFKAFADLGITGLTNEETVAAYHKMWSSHGSPDIKPGDTATLPTIKWTEVYESRGGWMDSPVTRERIAREVMASKPEVVAEAVVKVPAVRKAVVEKVARTGPLMTEVREKREEVIEETYAAAGGTTVHKKPDLRKSIGHVIEALSEFFDTDMSVGAGNRMTYRDVITEVLSNYGSPSFRDTIDPDPTVWMDARLLRALEALVAEGTRLSSLARIPAETKATVEA